MRSRVPKNALRISKRPSKSTAVPSDSPRRRGCRARQRCSRRHGVTAKSHNGEFTARVDDAIMCAGNVRRSRSGHPHLRRSQATRRAEGRPRNVSGRQELIDKEQAAGRVDAARAAMGWRRNRTTANSRRGPLPARRLRHPVRRGAYRLPPHDGHHRTPLNAPRPPPALAPAEEPIRKHPVSGKTGMASNRIQAPGPVCDISPLTPT